MTNSDSNGSNASNSNSEITPERRKELAREGSMINLQDKYLSGFACYAFGSQNPSEFGGFLQDILKYSTEETPSQLAYEKLGLQNMILSGQEFNMRDVFKSRAAGIISDSIADLLVDDVLEYRGLEGAFEDKKGKYISDLEDTDKAVLVGLYGRTMVLKKVPEVSEWKLQQENAIVRENNGNLSELANAA